MREKSSLLGKFVEIISFIFAIPLQTTEMYAIIQGATQLNNSLYVGIHFYYMVKVHALFSYTIIDYEKLCRSNRSFAFFGA